MRSILIVAAICVALTTVWIGNSQAAGLYVVEKRIATARLLLPRNRSGYIEQIEGSVLAGSHCSSARQSCCRNKRYGGPVRKPSVAEASAVPPETAEKENGLSKKSLLKRSRRLTRNQKRS